MWCLLWDLQSKGLAVPEGCRASHRAKLSLFWLKEGRQGLVGGHCRGHWWGVTLWVYS